MNRKIIAVISAAAALLFASGCVGTESVPSSGSTSHTSTSPATVEVSSVLTTAETSAVSTVAAESSSAPPSTTVRSAPRSEDFVRSGIVYNATENKIIFSKNPDEKMYPASLTKLVTACTALKYAQKTDIYTVGTELELVKPNSSLCLIRQGHRLTLEDLLYGLLTASGNDAAYTIAVNVARAAAEKELTDKEAAGFFCELMNDFSNELGMESSHFTTPDGWDDKRQYTTASDLLRLTEYVLSRDDIKAIVSCGKYNAVFASGQKITWKNSNLLLDKSSKYYYPYATGVKTGTTGNAGRCLVSAAEKDGKTIIAIGLGSKTDEQRYRFAIEMFNKAL